MIGKRYPKRVVDLSETHATTRFAFWVTITGDSGCSWLDRRELYCINRSKPARCKPKQEHTMARAESVDATRIGAKERNYGIQTPAEVVNVRFVCADVYASLFHAVGVDGEVNHHPGPEKFVSA
jgi:hypothetical protein